MENKLKKCNRRELLEILIAQQKEIKSLQEQLQQCKEELASKEVNIKDATSLIDATKKLNHAMAEVQAAADHYLMNLQQKECLMKEKETEILQLFNKIKCDTNEVNNQKEH